MTFIAIRRDAAAEIIAERMFQSTDFTEGNRLALQLRSGSFDDLGLRISLSKTKNGVFVYGKDPQEQRYVIFDVDQSRIFSDATNEQSVLYLQRVLRFCINIGIKVF
jgi:hypothetical protein